MSFRLILHTQACRGCATHTTLTPDARQTPRCQSQLAWHGVAHSASVVLLPQHASPCPGAFIHCSFVQLSAERLSRPCAGRARFPSADSFHPLRGGQRFPRQASIQARIELGDDQGVTGAVRTRAEQASTTPHEDPAEKAASVSFLLTPCPFSGFRVPGFRVPGSTSTPSPGWSLTPSASPLSRLGSSSCCTGATGTPGSCRTCALP